MPGGLIKSGPHSWAGAGLEVAAAAAAAAAICSAVAAAVETVAVVEAAEAVWALLAKGAAVVAAARHITDSKARVARTRIWVYSDGIQAFEDRRWKGKRF
jgi:hypothetical protein